MCLEDVFQTHRARIVQYLRMRLGSLADAEDAAQATFLRLYAKRTELNSGNLVALFYVTARNLATDLIRQNIRLASHVSREDQKQLEIADDAPDVERALEARERLGLLLKLLRELPQKCRISFVGVHFQGRSYEDIASELNVSESMIRKYVLKAVRYCAKRMDELEGWE